MHMLLHFHQPIDTFFVHDIFVDKIGEELEVQLDHLEIDQASLQQLRVYFLQFLYLLADADSEADYTVDFGMRPG